MGKALIEGRGDAMQAIKREFIERVKS
jgi:hypothetical protein